MFDDAGLKWTVFRGVQLDGMVDWFDLHPSGSYGFDGVAFAGVHREVIDIDKMYFFGA